jgi:hypothetical protein
MNLTVTAGQYGPFWWAEVQPGVDLYDLALLCPQLVLGKQIAIVTFDAGPLVPTDEEKMQGWSEEGGVAYTPEITDLERLPTAWCDEWYVNPPKGLARAILQFVTYSTFTLLDAPTPAVLAQQVSFWRQLVATQPETYLSSNEARSIVVTRSKALHAAAVLALQTASS